MSKIAELIVLVRGAGELASGVAHRLHHCHFQVCLTEVERPVAVRRAVAFSEAVYDTEKEVDGVAARLVQSAGELPGVWEEGKLPLIIDPQAKIKQAIKPDILIDAIVAKKNLGTKITDAPLVIGLGPGFEAGKDVHMVIETNRGHNLGRVIMQGEAEPNTGIPGEIAGISASRVIRASRVGQFDAIKNIGDHVQEHEIVAFVDGTPVEALIGGVIRGLLRDGTMVHQGMKAGDIDPRGIRENCYTISDKARAIAGGVLEAILLRFNI